MKTAALYGTATLGAAVLLLTIIQFAPPRRNAHAGGPATTTSRPIKVSGSAVHFFSTAVIHSQEQTENGMVQRSTDIIQLTGDLNGYILYHPTSTFDYSRNTLVNTGTQLFSGTVLGSPPVVLHDNTYRFDVDLGTGATVGQVHLSRSGDAPHADSWYDCDLSVVGTGVTPAGDNLADYTGECTPRGGMSGGSTGSW